MKLKDNHRCFDSTLCCRKWKLFLLKVIFFSSFEKFFNSNFRQQTRNEIPFLERYIVFIVTQMYSLRFEERLFENLS